MRSSVSIFWKTLLIPAPCPSHPPCHLKILDSASQFSKRSASPDMNRTDPHSGPVHPPRPRRKRRHRCLPDRHGKTAAFALPTLSKLKPLGKPQCLVLEPTRELAHQVAESIRALRKTLRPQSRPPSRRCRLRKTRRATQAAGADIVVATPGRLIDHFYRTTMRFGAVSVLILDEVDRMLDMGFLPQVRKIINVLPLEQRRANPPDPFLLRHHASRHQGLRRVVPHRPRIRGDRPPRRRLHRFPRLLPRRHDPAGRPPPRPPRKRPTTTPS